MERRNGIGHYREHASGYDASAQRTMALRRRTIARLGLRPGDVVLDAGCGTGLSIPLLLETVGDEGAVIGVEHSPEMLALARSRVAAGGWRNVTLIESAMEAARSPLPFSALLFNYVHDVIRSPAALDNVFRQAVDGAGVAVAGIKHPPRWLDPFRIYRRFKSRGCYMNTEGLDAPWDRLAVHVPDLRVESTLLGTGFIAWGRYRGVVRE